MAKPMAMALSEAYGYGVIKCLEGTYFEGNFDHGKMIGEFKLSPFGNAPTRYFDGTQGVGKYSYFPCESG
jgi:hypothetical protein